MVGLPLPGGERVGVRGVRSIDWAGAPSPDNALASSRIVDLSPPGRGEGERAAMFADRIEGKWIDAFCEVFERCAVKRGDTAAILSETQSRALNVQLAELALLRLGARPFHLIVPTPRNPHPVPVRSTGASEAIGGLAPVVAALGQAGFVVDCTLEGLMHAKETPAILKAGARILVVSNEHPEALERLAAEPATQARGAPGGKRA